MYSHNLLKDTTLPPNVNYKASGRGELSNWIQALVPGVKQPPTRDVEPGGCCSRFALKAYVCTKISIGYYLMRLLIRMQRSNLHQILAIKNCDVGGCSSIGSGTQPINQKRVGNKSRLNSVLTRRVRLKAIRVN
jgi:hypothetical protein